MVLVEDYSPQEIINNFIRENKVMRKNLKKFKSIIHKCHKDSVAVEFPETFEELSKMEEHFSFQEDFLFPMLVNADLEHPLNELNSRHDQIRLHLKYVLSAYERGHTEELCVNAEELMSEMKEIIAIEDKNLFPAALKYLKT